LNNEVTKNDKAWKLLFDKYKILDAIDTHGYFQIDAAQINEFREARLMTKFDHKANLPELFSKHNLAILPITRGSYIISRFDAYKEIEPIKQTTFFIRRIPLHTMQTFLFFLLSKDGSSTGQ